MADDDGVDTKSMSRQSVCRGAMAPPGPKFVGLGAAPSSSVKRYGHERAYHCFMRGSRSRRRQLSILRLQSRFIFGNKRTNLIGHVQKFQPLLFI
jgi:hypothetical protein